MTSRPDPKLLARFEASLERCLAAPTFIQRFYAHFMLRSDEARAKFAKTDMKRQEHMLRTSLYMMLRAAQGADTGLAHLRDIARTHSQRGYDIPPHLYQHWLDSLLYVVREVDPRFDESVEEAWREGLRPAIEVMTTRYDA